MATKLSTKIASKQDDAKVDETIKALEVLTEQMIRHHNTALQFKTEIETIRQMVIRLPGSDALDMAHVDALTALWTSLFVAKV